MVFSDGEKDHNTTRGTASVTPNVAYKVSFEILRNDLGDSHEYVTDVKVDGQSLGACHPDGGDFDCTFFTCPFSTSTVTSSSGTVALEIHIIGHSWDCDCDKSTWECSRENTVAGRTKMTAVGRFTFTSMDLGCGFEDGTEPYCNTWTQSTKDQFQWTRQTGNWKRNPQLSTGTGPDAAHQGQYYLYIETSGPQKNGDTAVLENCAVTLGTGAYLQFWHHMSGPSMGKLEVKVGNNVLWRMSGNRGNSWQLAKVALAGTGCVRIVGTVGTSYTGDAAIDDVRLAAGR